MDRKEGFLTSLETIKDFDIWSNQYLYENFDIVNGMLKVVNEKMKEEVNKEEQDKEEIEFCKFTIDKLKEAKKVTDKYKEQLTPIAEDVERLEDLSWIAMDVLYECGLRKLFKVDVKIDMRENKDRLGYYFPPNKKIFIHKHTLDNYSNTEIINILMHEYIHAWININFGDINDRVSNDESIIFSVMVDRVNKKLKRLNKGYYISQNGFNERYYKYYFKYRFKNLTDLRKSIKTIKNEIILTISELMEQYQTILLLEQKVINECRK